MVTLTKRKRLAVEEISFDPEQRREYLTGFHKRKLARAKKAREEIEKAAKAERLEDRRKLRESRKQELRAHVTAVQEFSRKVALEAGDIESGGDEAEWDGITDDESGEGSDIQGVGGEDEYVDEEKYTTVTVEAMDLGKEESEDEEAAAERMRKREEREREEEKLMKKKEARQRNGPKEKKKKFRYLTKSERRQDRAKVKMGKAKRRKEREGDKEGQRKGGKLGKARKK
ncbi:nucleolar protein 12-domain-containing protein [Tuber borchii]|uniref:Nucleolar protein 12-domain-containing protein n=1 Tax=Tuber borchii TaxID=42251 RepID=A0A2T6ZSG5_TUBBO|nr:nucleolar protein 12-domain-containing protein [Tuber borchii]